MTDEPLVPTPGELYIAYQTLAVRRTGYDAMLWQTPALGLTAQAFLLTLALSSSSTSLARLIAALLSLVLSLMTLQLMAKHRLHETLDSLLLERFEERLGLTAWLGVRPHGLSSRRLHDGDAGKNPATMRPRWFWSRSSYLLWQLGLASFGVASLVIIILVSLGLSGKALGTG